MLLLLLLLFKLHCFSNLPVDFLHNTLIFTTFYLYSSLSVMPNLQKFLTSFLTYHTKFTLLFRVSVPFFGMSSTISSPLGKQSFASYILCTCVCVTHTAVDVNLLSPLAGCKGEGYAFDGLIFP